MPTLAYEPESPTARTLRAVSRPPASQPAQYSMRIGWRLACIRRLSSRESVHFTGLLQQPCRQGRLRLVRHVLLAAEGAAVGHELDGDRVRRRRRAPGRCRCGRPRRPDRPSTRAGVPPSSGTASGRLGLQEGVLDALRLEQLVNGVGARGEGGVDVATGVLAHAQDVRVRAPHRDLRVVDGGDGVGERAQHVVVHVDQRGGGSRLLPGPGHHDGEHVAGVGRAAALGDEHRPVLVDQPDAQLTRHVGRGEHGDDTGRRAGGGAVDAAHVGAGVVGEAQGGVQQARRPQVVDVARGRRGRARPPRT